MKNLQSDHEEDDFIVKGIEKIVSTKEDKVAVLVRAGWQGNSVAQILDQKGILYFNALFKETDPEYISFYNIEKVMSMVLVNYKNFSSQKKVSICFSGGEETLLYARKQTLHY